MVGDPRDDEAREYVVSPERFGLGVHDIRALRVATVEESRERILSRSRRATSH